ncbi:hypothetical protein FQZ97_1191410 [compost metagenome]
MTSTERPISPQTTSGGGPTRGSRATLKQKATPSTRAMEERRSLPALITAFQLACIRAESRTTRVARSLSDNT